MVPKYSCSQWLKRRQSHTRYDTLMAAEFASGYRLSQPEQSSSSRDDAAHPPIFPVQKIVSCAGGLPPPS